MDQDRVEAGALPYDPSKPGPPSMPIAPEQKPKLPIADSAEPELDPEQKALLQKMLEGKRFSPEEMRRLSPGKMEGGKLVVKLDGCEAVIHELSGQEIQIGDSMLTTGGNADLQFQTYALIGLDKLTLGGQEMVMPPPTNDFNVGNRSRLFKHGRHLKALGQAYALFFMMPMSEDELKNA